MFFYAGMFMSSYPWVSIVFYLVLCGLCVPGLLNLKITNDPVALWANPDGELFHQQNKFADIFGHFMRSEMVIFKPRDEKLLAQEDFNIIKKDYLLEMMYFQKIMQYTKVEVDVATMKEKKFDITPEIMKHNGKNFTMADLCWSSFPNDKCTYMSPGGYFQNNLTRLMQYTDEQIPEILLCTKSIDPENTLPCEDETGIPVQKSACFGQLEQIYSNNKVLSHRDAQERYRQADCTKNGTCDNGTRRLFLTKTQKFTLDLAEDNACKSFTYRAKTLNIEVLLNYQDQTDFISQQWEQKAIIDTVKLWEKHNNTAFLADYFPDDKTIPLDKPLQ